jgi:two-component system sensor histidine kinase CreC
LFLGDAFSDVYERRLEARIYTVLKTHVDLRVYMTDERGMVTFDSKGEKRGADFSHWNDVIRTLNGNYGARATRTNSDDPLTSIMHVSAPIYRENQIVGVMIVSKPPETTNLFVRAAQKKLTLIAGGAAVVLIVLIVFVTSMITNPILRLKNYALAIADGNNPPKPKFAPKELAELAQAFEQMREALDGKLYIEQYVQNLTHEIKGPLTGIRAASELLQESMPDADKAKFLKNITADAARLQDITDRLLNLTEIERTKALVNPAELHLAAVMVELSQVLSATLIQKQLELETCGSENCVILGDAFLLKQAFFNLLQNAADFAIPHTKIQVVFRRIENSGLQIFFDNQGPHIPEYGLSRVFERFYSLPRPGTGRKSTGLGLAFVQEIARLHGGTVSIENSEFGVRAILTLSFKKNQV